MDNVDYSKLHLNELIKKDQSEFGKKNTDFDVNEFYQLLETNKKNTEKVLSNINYNLNEENISFLKYYYSLIFLLENKFENYSDFQKKLLIESIELEIINKMIEHGLNYYEIKQTINSYLNTHPNYLRKKFDLCNSVTDIKEKHKRYIDSIHYIKEIFERPNNINAIEGNDKYERK